MKNTWKPHDAESSAPDNQASLPASAFAFPGQRKEPMTDASHVRNAIARFDQVKDVSDAEREQAFANLKAAAKHFNVDMTETSWHQLGGKPHTPNRAAKKSSRKTAPKSAGKAAKSAAKRAPSATKKSTQPIVSRTAAKKAPRKAAKKTATRK